MKGFLKILIIIGVSSGIYIALAIFLIVPVLKDVNGLNILVKEKQIELATLDKQILAFKTAQSDLEKADRKAEIANALVSKEDLVIPIKELEKSADTTITEHAIIIKEPDPKAKPVLANRVGFSEINYSLSTTSTNFGSAINFLQYLEHLPHFTELSNIILSSETSGTDPVTEEPIRTGRVFGEYRGVFIVKPLPTTPTTTTTTK